MTVTIAERVATQPEAPVLFDLPGKQPIQRSVEMHEAVEIQLVNLELLAFIIQTFIHDALIPHVLPGNDDLYAIGGTDTIAVPVSDPRQRRIVDGVGTPLRSRREGNLHTPIDNLEHDPQTQLRLGAADPALAGRVIVD